MIWILPICLLAFTAALVIVSFRPKPLKQRETKVEAKQDLAEVERRVFAKADEVKRAADESSPDLMAELKKDETEREKRINDTATMRSISRKVDEVQRLSESHPEKEKAV